ncbi:MAG: imidazolonepropionase [Bacteroidetes bacterium]|nr:MAG: imidazolonepropionase [Bacteroidota bacterium]
MHTLFINITQLVSVQNPTEPLRGKELQHLPFITHAYVWVKDGIIQGFGKMSDGVPLLEANIIDCDGGFLLPTYCDSHTHLVFAAYRENEFVQKIKGSSYAEIAASGGGILNSALAVQNMEEDRLFELAAERLHKLILLGTGAIEIKSGYGLLPAAELKMLRVIQRLKQAFPMPIKATYLAAHAVPPQHTASTFVQEVINHTLPQVAEENLADFVDVFCEKGFFTPEQTIDICTAAAKLGLPSKIHANQLHISGGVQAGVAVNAVSVDHLESMDVEAIHALAASQTIGTLLPTAAWFLRMAMPPAQQLLAADCAIALATDFNPGSSPSGNMNLVLSMACVQMRLTPQQAINAATIQGAFAMQLQHVVGSIAVGKRANFILTKPIKSVDFLPYSFGENSIQAVFINGRLYK